MSYRMLWIFSSLCLFMLLKITDSQLVSCYYEFSRETGSCHRLIGNVTQEECCYNYYYGFINENGECQSCRKASWSEWSSWGPCSVSCLKGVQRRRRRCDGIGECKDPELTQQIQVCQDQDCCPEQGGWAEWGEWQPCSVTCANGTEKRDRTCSNPPPTCGGGCDGLSQDTQPCQTKNICPTHGGWAEWGAWGPCSGTCKKEGSVPPSRQRRRSCTNPPPSSAPAGLPCPGDDVQSQHCDYLDMCPIDGKWGHWGPLSQCSVTCGVGQKFSSRSCDNPAPKYGGRPCVGDSSASEICKIENHCPLHGEWEAWGEWSACTKSTYNRPISCTKKTGQQKRRRTCDKEFEGKPCDGSIMELRPCYDITHTKDRPCEKTGNYTEWSEWSFCSPKTGKRERKRVCELPEFETKGGTDIYYYGDPPKVSCPRLALPDRRQSEDCPKPPEEWSLK
ncbi:properdin-like [Engraulis encrasicolus]|uniref:properdin-like n=1 Tax=Engraulis encrasicolus TaxID=184585 RepID=UPI002FD68059